MPEKYHINSKGKRSRKERIQSVLTEIEDFDYETQRWIRNKYKK